MLTVKQNFYFDLMLSESSCCPQSGYKSSIPNKTAYFIKTSHTYGLILIFQLFQGIDRHRTILSEMKRGESFI